MLEELDQAYNGYKDTWQRMVASRQNAEFFESLRATALGWKTTDLADFDARYAELREYADHIHTALLNGRWIAVFHLKEVTIGDGIQLVKLMQRRPGSDDAVGLDHVDFYSPQVAKAETILAEEPNLKWGPEENGICSWISIWFDNTEAKLRTGTTLDICIKEFEIVNKQIIG